MTQEDRYKVHTSFAEISRKWVTVLYNHKDFFYSGNEMTLTATEFVPRRLVSFLQASSALHLPVTINFP